MHVIPFRGWLGTTNSNMVPKICVIIIKGYEVHLLRGSVLKFLHSGNENTATFSADDFCKNSNIYLIACVYRTSKAVKFYLLRSSKNHKY